MEDILSGKIEEKSLNEEGFLPRRKTGTDDVSPRPASFVFGRLRRSLRTTLIYCLDENRLKSIHRMTVTLIWPSCFSPTILLCGINNIIMIEGQPQTTQLYLTMDTILFPFITPLLSQSGARLLLVSVMTVLACSLVKSFFLLNACNLCHYIINNIHCIYHSDFLKSLKQ